MHPARIGRHDLLVTPVAGGRRSRSRPREVPAGRSHGGHPQVNDRIVLRFHWTKSLNGHNKPRSPSPAAGRAVSRSATWREGREAVPQPVGHHVELGAVIGVEGRDHALDDDLHHA